MSNVELARKLGVTEKVVRRLLDPDHQCRIDRLEDALRHFGLCLELKVRRDHRTDRREHQVAPSPDVDQADTLVPAHGFNADGSCPSSSGTGVPQHGVHCTSRIDGPNLDSRMRYCENAENFVGKPLADMPDTAHIHLDFGKLVQIVQQPFRL